jgi:Transcriptional regulators
MPAKGKSMARPPGGKERKRITIRDVAARAGVDASLVSRVLNDHPKASAGPATRERILEAARASAISPTSPPAACAWPGPGPWG